ncbi:WhiB family transcriptional regulator [Actinotignum urinale]|uniref:Transcriptional regulator WhiB n=1 Tax=Actinotignum urinale TaxID=190146 RepID=A0ABU5G8P1_9ACTO|nr:WhiB family transcriptional regulator [Actinotignum urinale]MDY5133520.1 WhiB family transcriptional regulator [Actinotignum urinale]MDY5151649.1 WhiB family transcriptional regulator [Actinotignum urinale]MDY5160951.1 WhiB family transcriptional regulator [Actinotignum urinale]
MDWRTRAECLSEDPELFFPVGSSAAAIKQTERAKSICRSCTVVHQCLSYALENGQDSGVWGGRSEDERKKMRRKKTIIHPITNSAVV